MGITSLRFTVQTVEGKVLLMETPIRMQCVKSFDSPADSLFVLFPCDRVYPELTRIDCSLNGKKIFKGMVDEQCTSSSDQGYTLQISARSEGALLLDNEALPQVYYSPSLNDIFTRHIRPYGFDRLVYSANVRLTWFVVRKGMSEWDALYEFFRLAAGAPCYIDDNLNVIAKGEAPLGRTITLAQGTPYAYSDLKSTISRYSVITKICVRDSRGYYTSAYNNPDEGAAGIRRKRYFIPDTKFSTSYNTFADIHKRLRQSMLEKSKLVVLCPDLVDVSIGDRVNIADPVVSGWGLFLQGITYTLSDKGCSTQLTLQQPNYL